MQEILIGPFKQLLTMRDLPLKGALKDSELEVIEKGGIWIENGIIKEVDEFEKLRSKVSNHTFIHNIAGDKVCLPSFIDCHTHIAFVGSRANDFAMRNAGSSYLEIAEAGGGIWSTVQHTREASLEELKELTKARAEYLLAQGITTVEVKSGYGLKVDEELKTLRAIKQANAEVATDLVSTCLAAHMKPKDFEGSPVEYLRLMADQLFPVLLNEKLTERIDAFIEKTAFSVEDIQEYFTKAKEMGFTITVHADQFSTSGSAVAIAFDAVSADHLEASSDLEVQMLASSDVVAVALPAASLGIGCAFTPARRLLDAGASLAIATDWNPGSAPMGQLVSSASILGTMEKLSNAEVLAGITFRAAHALRLSDRGRLVEGKLADFVIYDTGNYQDVTYLQGTLQPNAVWKNGVEVCSNKK